MDFMTTVCDFYSVLKGEGGSNKGRERMSRAQGSDRDAPCLTEMRERGRYIQFRKGATRQEIHITVSTSRRVGSLPLFLVLERERERLLIAAARKNRYRARVLVSMSVCVYI